jgi:hypothetical protein
MVTVFLFTPPVTPLTENWLVAVAVLFDKVFVLALIVPLALFGKKISIVYGALFFFLLGFVGNEADNMWGSLAFATPIVYENIFMMPLDFVRAAFLGSPFLYPVIRIIQGFIVMLIAVPLMHTLKTTKLLWRKDNILEDDHSDKKLEKQTAESP